MHYLRTGHASIYPAGRDHIQMVLLAAGAVLLLYFAAILYLVVFHFFGVCVLPKIKICEQRLLYGFNLVLVLLRVQLVLLVPDLLLVVAAVPRRLLLRHLVRLLLLYVVFILVTSRLQINLGEHIQLLPVVLVDVVLLKEWVEEGAHVHQVQLAEEILHLVILGVLLDRQLVYLHACLLI